MKRAQKMEKFTTNLVQITDNLREAYNELLICHKGKGEGQGFQVTRLIRVHVHV